MRVPLRSGRRGNIIDGVYSLQTALSAHDLTEIVPSQRHITVAKSTQSELPDMIVLQYGEISGLDVELVLGMVLTKPMRTIMHLPRRARCPFIAADWHFAWGYDVGRSVKVKSRLQQPHRSE
jgi:hypothetical protein